MVTGQKLFSAKTNMELVIQHVMAPPSKPRSIIHDLPIAIEEIILTALSKDLEKRYQTMAEFSQALQLVQSNIKPDVQRRITFSKSTRRLAGILAGVFGLVVLVMLLSKRSALEIPPAVSLDATDQASQTVASVLTPGTEDSQLPVKEYLLPELPVLPGSALPGAEDVLDPSNVGGIVELARWGSPDVRQMSFINNDQILLAATSAGVYYFESASLVPKHFFHTGGRLTTFSISLDGERIATGDDQGSVVVWNVYTGLKIVQFGGDAGPVTALDFSPDGSKLVAATASKTINIWDLKQEVLLFSLKGHLLKINKVIFTPNGNNVISGGDDFQIMIWDVQNGGLINKYLARQKINDMDITSTGDVLAVALNDATIELWNLGEGKLKSVIRDVNITSPFTSIRFLPSDQFVLTGSGDGFVRIWNILGSGKTWETPSKPTQVAPVRTLSISKDATKFVVIFEDGVVEIWDIPNQKLVISKQLRFEAIMRMAMSPDDHLLALQRGNSLVELWSIPDANQTGQISGSLPRGNPFSPENERILIESGDLNIYSLATKDPKHLFTFKNFPENGFVSFLLDGDIVAAATGSLFNYWSASTGRQLISSSTKTEGNCSLYFRVNGSFLAASSANGIISSDKNLNFFCLTPRNPRTVAEDFPPDGSIIAFSLENRNLEIWTSRQDGEKTVIPTQSTGDLLDIAMSVDGSLLAATSASGTVEIYDLATLKLIKTVDLETGPVNQVLFSNDGKYIILGSTDGTVRFFGLPSK
jgi:WD40 repeat protein